MKILKVHINEYDSFEELVEALDSEGILVNSFQKAEKLLNDTTRIFYFEKDTYNGKTYYQLYEAVPD